VELNKSANTHTQGTGLQTCVQSNFMKFYQAGQKLIVGDTQTHSHTDRQAGDLISLLSFLKSRLKTLCSYGLPSISGILNSRRLHFQKVQVVGTNLCFQCP
jgi:hypothetical protein